MKKYKIIIWILVVINISLITFMVLPHRPHERPRIVNILNIEDARASDINSKELIHFYKKKKLMDKSRNLRAKLLLSFENELPASQADSILQLISANQYELDKMTYLFFKDIKSKCSEKERKQLNGFFTKVLEGEPRHKK